MHIDARKRWRQRDRCLSPCHIGRGIRADGDSGQCCVAEREAVLYERARRVSTGAAALPHESRVGEGLERTKAVGRCSKERAQRRADRRGPLLGSYWGAKLGRGATWRVPDTRIAKALAGSRPSLLAAAPLSESLLVVKKRQLRCNSVKVCGSRDQTSFLILINKSPNLSGTC